mmetsp:Transcript_6874/g.8531  ORF Transcript_6874/g.8531 Transcript_6874/m.8531 type:complete len:97 (-) Transcript_6874:355-645(-)
MMSLLIVKAPFNNTDDLSAVIASFKSGRKSTIGVFILASSGDIKDEKLFTFRLIIVLALKLLFNGGKEIYADAVALLIKEFLFPCLDEMHKMYIIT